MNRKERRAAGTRAADRPGIAELLAVGRQHLAAGRYNNAAKQFSQALALDERNATAHDGLGMALQAQDRRDEAVQHFMQAIALGLADVEGLIKQRPPVGACLKRFRDAWPRRLSLVELLGADGLAGLAHEPLLIALLQSRPVADVELELFLTSVRAGLLQGIASPPDAALDFAVALALQCFINEYVFSPGPGELDAVQSLRDRIATGEETSALAVAVAAMYAPLPGDTLHAPEALIRQQVREPREEAEDRIPALTAIDDPVSREVQRQYEENPYPRWTVATPVRPMLFEDYLRRCLPLVPDLSLGSSGDILIAGCGTGGHSIDTARRFPQSNVLAIDISRTSLAYARRKTREIGLSNVEYAQADILELGVLDRSFDVIETVGVLHHLTEPEAGFRMLVERLRPGGLMLVGLYSELARRAIIAARALIAERGYAPTLDGIRQCRQELIHRGEALPVRDFYSVSGCRDLLFNVMEHRFTIPRISALLAETGMTLLGFEASAEVLGRFARRFPVPQALTDLGSWDAFEREHPATFANMYVFWLQKPAG